MCIRDSDFDDVAGRRKAVRTGCADPRAVDMKNPVPNFKGCLLYTSDAADERSSVDLGGRRIIKKKNRDKITERMISQEEPGAPHSD